LLSGEKIEFPLFVLKTDKYTIHNIVDDHVSTCLFFVTNSYFVGFEHIIIHTTQNAHMITISPPLAPKIRMASLLFVLVHNINSSTSVEFEIIDIYFQNDDAYIIPGYDHYLSTSISFLSNFPSAISFFEGYCHIDDFISEFIQNIFSLESGKISKYKFYKYIQLQICLMI